MGEMFIPGFGQTDFETGQFIPGNGSIISTGTSYDENITLSAGATQAQAGDIVINASMTLTGEADQDQEDEYIAKRYRMFLTFDN